MIEILNLCHDYIVCKKPSGVSSQSCSAPGGMPELISETISVPVENIYPVHRLDMPVGGTMIYALNQNSAGILSSLMNQHKIEKCYLAVVHGKPQNPSGLMEDLLFKDSRTNKSYVVNRMRKGVKKALLEYQVLDTEYIDSCPLSLVKILLHTGRTHQIRVQFSHRKMPLVGDRRYGSGKDNCDVALWSNTLGFVSPFDSEEKCYTSFPDTDAFPWCIFDKKHFCK